MTDLIQASTSLSSRSIRSTVCSHAHWIDVVPTNPSWLSEISRNRRNMGYNLLNARDASIKVVLEYGRLCQSGDQRMQIVETSVLRVITLCIELALDILANVYHCPQEKSWCDDLPAFV